MPLTNLNKQQLTAATANFGHNLIIASAGTGKTSTIVGRIAYLLKKGVQPHEILLLTFTNKAAMQMIQRVAGFFGDEVASNIDAGTFHAVSYRWLKKNDTKVALKQPRELKTLFRSVHDRRNFSHIDAEVVPFGGNYLYDLYLFFQNTQLDADFESWICKTQEAHCPFAMIYADIVDEFEALKQQYGFLNFNDLLIKMRQLCQSKDLGYKEVLIDEYQDTNALQGALIDAMDTPSLFCVGDYDQSIYAFNGADISIIGSFADKFKDATIFTLNKNYRSTVAILSLANKAISYNKRIYEKKLEFTRTDTDAKAPVLTIYDELFEQYRAVAVNIQNSTTNHDDIAVIFRNNASADGIEVSLKELNIACRRRGGISFFDSKEIKAILDIYMFLTNESDMMAFMHIFEHAKGIGSAMSKELYIALKTLGGGSVFLGLDAPNLSIINPFQNRQTNHQLGLFDDFLELGAAGRFATLGFSDQFLKNPILKHPKLTKEGAKFLYYFYNLQKVLKKIKQPKTIVLKIAKSELYGIIIDTLSTKRAQLKDGSIDSKLKSNAEDKIARKVLLLQELAKPYQEHERFLNAMILGSSDLTQGEGVHLLSVHASKGLEYKEVYIVDLMDGRFPNRKLMLKGGSIEEERRLFYVAITRAKDILYLSFAKYDKIKKATFVASQFLYEAGLIAMDGEYKKLMNASEE